MGTGEIIESIDEALNYNPLMGEGLPPNWEELVREGEETRAELGQLLTSAGIRTPEVVAQVERVVERAAAAETQIGQAVYYQAISELIKANQIQPNGGTTLVGPGGAGALYATGTQIPLVPSQALVVGATPFQLQNNMIMLEMETLEIDAERGWQLIANTVRLNNDPYSGFQFDTSFVVWTSRATARRPLASLLTIEGPRDNSAPLLFTASAGNHGPAAAPLEGVTVLLWDGRCIDKIRNLNKPRLWRLVEAAREGKLVDAVLNQARAKLSPPPTATPAGSRFRVVPGLRNLLSRR